MVNWTKIIAIIDNIIGVNFKSYSNFAVQERYINYTSMIIFFRAYKYILSAILLLFFGASLQCQEIISTKIKTVVIDAGHGGQDPGALGSVSREKDITLAIASKLRDVLSNQFSDLKIIMTREDDYFVKLIDRAEIANKNKADLFISIHANSNVKRDVKGAEFWVLGLHKAGENLDVAKKENEVVNLEGGDLVSKYGFDPNSPEGTIIMTMKQGLYLDKSIQIAKSIEKNFAIESMQVNRGTKQAGFVVLYKTAMPSVLVEVGFISNRDEEAFLNSESGQNEIAQKIANAFAEYKLKYEQGNAKSTDIIKLDLEAPKVDLSSKKSEPKTKPEVNNAPTPKRKIISVLDDEEPIKPIESKPTNSFKDRKVINSSSLEMAANKRVVILEDELDQINSKPKSQEKLTNLKPIENFAKDDLDEITSTKKNWAMNAEPIKKTPSIATKPIEPKPKSPESFNKKTEVEPTTKTDTKAPSFTKNESVKQAILENAKELATVIPNQEPIKKISADNATSSVQIKKASLPTGTVYKVQVKAGEQALNSDNPILARFKEVEESYENNLYKYLVGSFKSLENAKTKLLEIRASGIQDAFLVKYTDGVRVKL
jgi:N-acetylmuramoyl-L-alanine amidase